jgi:virginiamycin B lyase
MLNLKNSFAVFGAVLALSACSKQSLTTTVATTATSTDGVVHEFVLPTANSGPTTIAVAADGSLWFTLSSGNAIGHIQADLTAYEEFPLPSANSGPRVMSLGSDGNMWFSEHTGNRMARITPQGEITEFPLPRPNSGPGDITAGSDGALWFLELSGTMDGLQPDGNRVGRISTSGEITEYPEPSTTPTAINIAVGPDGNVWYSKSSKLGRVTSAGEITEIEIGTGTARAVGLSAGSDRQPPTRLTDKLWFTDSGLNRIGYLQFE